MNTDALWISADVPSPRRRVKGVLPLLLCVALWGAFLDMIGQMALLPWASLASLPALFGLLCREEKQRRIVASALLLLILLFALLQWRAVTGGLALLLNRLFDVSAARQRYLYEKFTVTAENPIPAVIVLAALLSTLFGWLASWREAAPGVLAILAAAAGCAYFGVTPNAAWLLAILLCAGLMLLPKPDARSAACLLILTVGIAGLTLLLFPNENARVSAADEQLRDRLAITTVTEQRQPENTPTPTPETQPEAENPAPMLLQIREQMDPKIIILIVTIVVILLLLFVPAVIRDRLQKRRDRNRAGMDSADPAEAIRATYRYALLWLRAGETDAQEIPGCGEAYRLWQEAAFSDHPMTETQRDAMLAFQKEAANTVWNRAGKFEKLRLSFRYALSR